MKARAPEAVRGSLVLLFVAAAMANVAWAGKYEQLIQACTQLNHHYAIAHDTGDAATYDRIFSDDAEFVMQGKTYLGKEAILMRLTGSEASYFARLLVTTVAITPLDQSSARGVTYFTMFQAPNESAEQFPITSFKTFMGEYHDQYLFDGSNCRLSRRETRPLFKGTAEED